MLSWVSPFNPRLTGVSAERHWPGGGGAYNAPPPASTCWVRHNLMVSQTGPNSAETLSKVRRRYCMSVNAILSTGQGHGQVTKGHYIQKSHCSHVIHVLWPILAIEFDGYVSLVVWDRFQKFLAKVRSRSGQKRSNFQIYKCGQKRYQSWPVLAQESNGVICFCVRPPEVTKIAFEKIRHNWVCFRRQKTLHLGSKIELLTWNFVHW